MRILLQKASNYSIKIIKEEQTAEDILNLINEFNESIIIERGGYFNTHKKDKDGEIIIDENFDYTITIYDDYIE